MTKKNLTILLGFFVFAIFGVLFALISLIFGGEKATIHDIKEAASKLGKEGASKKKKDEAKKVEEDAAKKAEDDAAAKKTEDDAAAKKAADEKKATA